MNAVRPGTVLPTARSTVSNGKTAGQSPPSDVVEVGLGLVGFAVVVDVAATEAEVVNTPAAEVELSDDGVFELADVELPVHAAAPSSNVSAVASTTVPRPPEKPLFGLTIPMP